MLANRSERMAFLRDHVESVYDRLTNGLTRFVRVEELVLRAADAYPGLVPTRAALAEEAGRKLKDKEGIEVDQSLLLAHILANPRCGTHLCHAMLLPRPETAVALAALDAQGFVDLGAVRVERHGRAAHLLSSNPRYLNAEDQGTIEAMEIGVDVAILDPGTDIAVLRGQPVQHAKYAGRRIFGSGINLTHLYHGSIPFVWYLQRELGFMHKYFRGVATPDVLPDDVNGVAREKPWIAAVEGWAIGGHCQILLAMDYVLATRGSFITLPARKEGIIPGAANLRLARFTGDRLARQLIQAERRIESDSAEGRLLCDEIIPDGGMDEAIEDTVALLTSSGAVGAIGNRRALRVAVEPLDLFRRYCAVYAREQASCHFSPALVRNLEENWGAGNRAV
ncbi:enoyl-CoA hydratase/isomerase family protein [Acidisphaera sp. S103]|uniref:enoyl-CoA hydratase/isomerase family protein n=1 Tax=Acidisphaera sp. S103 TaxID=1747223 RepID=UPI0020B158E2|nr:enoyl-CoA hydratase/isomerase family protein [Acidisphaera sp. S103]